MNNTRQPKNRHNKYSKKKDFDVRTVCPGLKVVIHGDDERSFTKALRTFSKKVQDSRLLRELREREYYEKPSIIRDRARAVAIKREAKRRESTTIVKKRLY